MECDPAFSSICSHFLCAFRACASLVQSVQTGAVISLRPALPASAGVLIFKNTWAHEYWAFGLLNIPRSLKANHLAV